MENKSSFENRATNGLRIQPGMIQNLKLSQIVSGYWTMTTTLPRVLMMNMIYWRVLTMMTTVIPIP